MRSPLSSKVVVRRSLGSSVTATLVLLVLALSGCSNWVSFAHKPPNTFDGNNDRPVVTGKAYFAIGAGGVILTDPARDGHWHAIHPGVASTSNHDELNYAQSALCNPKLGTFIFYNSYVGNYLSAAVTTGEKLKITPVSGNYSFPEYITFSPTTGGFIGFDSSAMYTSQLGYNWKATTFLSGKFGSRARSYHLKNSVAGDSYWLGADARNTDEFAYLARSDDGLTWTTVEVPMLGPGKSGAVQGIYTADSNNIVIVIQYKPVAEVNSFSKLWLQSADGGRNWTQFAGVNRVMGVLNTSEGRLYYVLNSTGKFATTTDLLTLTVVTPPTTDVPNFIYPTADGEANLAFFNTAKMKGIYRSEASDPFRWVQQLGWPSQPDLTLVNNPANLIQRFGECEVTMNPSYTFPALTLPSNSTPPTVPLFEEYLRTTLGNSL